MHQVCIRRLLLKLVCFLLLTFLLQAPLFLNIAKANSSNPREIETASTNQLRLVVKASPRSAYQTEELFNNKKIVRELKKNNLRSPYEEPVPPDTALSFEENGHNYHFGVTAKGEVINLSQKIIVDLPTYVREVLVEHVRALRAKHYGEILPWEQASEALPKYSKFTITDLESGLSFEGQRRAGSSHADVQPLTKQDSATLKTIYDGAWSWDRKAVLVKLNGRTLAGSMHGMPHGGDGIPGNDFNGHFCIHFLGSVTHGSRSADPAHQVMVYKAAGLLTEYISKLNPWQLIDVWISGANQGDLQLLQVTTGQEQAVHMRTMRRLSKFPELDTSKLLQLDAAVDVSATPEGSNSTRTRRVLFHLARVSSDTRWYIRSAIIQ
ncbi:hypothetical protein GK047_04715 [Paenibacillus sp. SYP-B3998]|uniref:Uncharacterized protein n=1 Tax=Paenibacillus sp. SYP-B3998 TaxID=2678564 RepID=A0A6G3ZT56_9BACL|nr:hypothetical protein [Paenibacillus sp. SYP-B3998]NEW05322.1 hypothetical protein [Paenibacillus sp. SYP-B3998]